MVYGPCPGTEAREGTMRKLWIVLGIFALLFVIGQFESEEEEQPEVASAPQEEVEGVPPAKTVRRDNQALQDRLSYLGEIDEISWIEFEDNNVYIGFKRRPSDLGAIVNSAAVWGNRAHGFGVHVWATDARYRGWRPGLAPYYCEATGRYGKLQDSCDSGDRVPR